MLRYHLFRKNCEEWGGLPSFPIFIKSDCYMDMNHKEHFLSWNLIVSKPVTEQAK